MDLLIGGGRFGNAPAELDDQLLQLPVDVAPLLHAVEGEEMLAAGLVQLAAGFPVRERFLEEIPEFDPGKEIRLLEIGRASCRERVYRWGVAGAAHRGRECYVE